MAGNEDAVSTEEPVAVSASDIDLAWEVLNLWVDLWRDLLLIKTGLNGAITNIDIEEELSQLAREISLLDIRRFIKKIQETIQNLRRNANPRLVLEVLMMDIPVRKKERIGS